MNKVILIGNLSKDPILRSTAGATPTSVCQFTIACSRKYKNAEGKTDADFINCVAWRQTAEFINRFFKKGSRIAVTGSIQVRSYDKDGQKQFVTEVVVDEAEFVESKKTEGGFQDGLAPTQAPAKPAQPEAQNGNEYFVLDDNDSVPF